MIYYSFFLSGAAALLYEVVWVRRAGLFCGNTAVAAAAVLAAFMAGLALGSWLGGRAADRRRRGLLALYGALELGIAAGGLLSMVLLGLAGELLLQIGVLSWPAWLRPAAYFGAAFAVLLAPTTLMGATLPVLTRALSAGHAGRPLARLYAVNLAGAVVGTAAAGFLLLPLLGMNATALVAAAANVLAAVLSTRAEEAPPPPAPAPAAHAAREQFLSRPGLFLAMTGAAAMVCQVAWTRAFAMTLGSTTYAFTIMLLTFLLGLAGGSALYARWRGRLPRELSGAGWLAAAVGLAVYAGMPLWNVLPYALSRMLVVTGIDADLVFAVQFLLCASVMAVPTLLMGAVFPWAAAAARPRGADVGAQTGGLYAANTAGAIIGSAAGGLLLVPYVGVSAALGAAIALYAAAAALAAWGSKRKRILAAAAVLLALAWARPSWSPRLLSSGMFLYASHYDDAADYQEFRERLARDRVIFERHGANATVTVLEGPAGARYLRVNGKTDASESGDIGTQLLAGLLPRLMHDGAPKRALNIGLGSGMTAAALLDDAGLQRLDVVEIEPAVAEAARLFARANMNALDDPRLRLYYGDARQTLAAPGPSYDLIVSEPSNPWIAGIANLFTREAFALARAKLAPGGVFCQWIQGYYISEDDMRLVLRTFADVFPHAQVFSNGTADYFLIGRRQPFDVSYERLSARTLAGTGVREGLIRLERGLDHPFTLLARTFVLGDRDLRAFAGPGRLHRDDRPTLEFTSPRRINVAGADALYERMTDAKTTMLPDGLYGLALDDRLRARLYTVAAEALLDSDEPASAAAPIEQALRYDPQSARAVAARGRFLADVKREPQAGLAALKRALRLDPGEWRVRLALAKALVSAGQDAAAAEHLRAGLKAFAAEPRMTMVLAQLEAEAGRGGAARELLDAALAKPVPDGGLRRGLWDLRKSLAGQAHRD